MQGSPADKYRVVHKEKPLSRVVSDGEQWAVKTNADYPKTQCSPVNGGVGE